MKKKSLRVIKAVAIIVLSVILSGVLLSCGQKEQKKYPQPTDQGYVNDFAGVISEEDATAICGQGQQLQEKTNALIVVVTIESLDGAPAKEYAYELGREWGVGSEEDNGIVILFSESDREIEVAMGEGLEGDLPDSKIGRIIDNYAMQYFLADDFSTGLASLYDAFTNEVYIKYDMQPDEDYVAADILPGTIQDESTSAARIAISWVVLIILIVVYMLVFGRRGMFIFGAPRFFGGFGGFGGGSFGGFGGSGGSSGSFGGFGGGSFGGGGAGRKF